MAISNPFLNLNYEPALESLGSEYCDRVEPAKFSQYILRFRNDNLLPILGLNSATVSDRHFLDFGGSFLGKQSRLALRYHGYQFGQYNPYLGDGRGFLYGQVRGIDGQLYDFGTKGSGQTPYSQSGNGRLTLKSGVREVLVAEALHCLGVKTSRCLSLIETEAITRNGEKVRGAVMVRLSRSHLRFGTFERLEYYDRPDLIRQLLDHVIQYYYPHLWQQPDSYIRFYAALVRRMAQLVAQWMAVGFCHGVLNTDNMSIIGESFDYGSCAFIDTYNPCFTAASFDRQGRYSYRHQQSVCRWNLAMLQRPLAAVIPISEMEAILESFPELYTRYYHQQMLQKLGFDCLSFLETEELIDLTLQFLFLTKVGYQGFFSALRQKFAPQWRENPDAILQDLEYLVSREEVAILKRWCWFYHQLLLERSPSEIKAIAQRLERVNPLTALLQSKIESIWQAIREDDNWQPFIECIKLI
ncbi:YdiU family protein [Myxosarcina sp. GI1]|uniref:protein adenylyltransferase SelO n=1 Tax=Myxosarcina sp. GI1 TaxID=1541065 RepID=UPI0005648437|nr:YdiU family protein [Myxosarcina sp. GI1]